MRSDLFKTPVDEGLVNHINITALIDVMLVLLVAFIMIAPIMEQGISLNLPKATAAKIKTKDALSVDVDKNGQIYLDTMPVSKVIFQKRLEAVAALDKEQAILIRADQDNKYGEIVQIIDMIKLAGLEKVGILTRAKDKNEKQK